jgi:hypothetical protein
VDGDGETGGAAILPDALSGMELQGRVRVKHLVTDLLITSVIWKRVLKRRLRYAAQSGW